MIPPSQSRTRYKAQGNAKQTATSNKRQKTSNRQSLEDEESYPDEDADKERIKSIYVDEIPETISWMMIVSFQTRPSSSYQ